MSHRRTLLLCAGDGAAFIMPHAAFDVSAAPYGTGTDIQWPMAIYGAGKTYIGLVQGTSDPNDIGVVAWDNTTATLGTPFLLHAALSDGGSTVPDTHNQPAVTRLADGTIVTAYCGHGSHDMRIRVSTSPDDLSAFGTEYVITSSYFLTYPQLFVMSGGRIYLRARATLGGVAYIIQWYSDDDGATWDIGTLIFSEGTDNIYSAAATDGTYIDHVVIDRSPDHVGGWWMGHWRQDEAGDNYLTDGTPTAGFPLNASDVTEVFAPGSYRFPRGIVYDSGTPVIAWDSAQADPVLMGESRWSGSAWVPETITSSGPLYAGGTSVGGGKHGWDNADTFYTAIVTGGPIDTTGSSDIWRFRRVMGTWDSGVQITHAGQDPYAPFTVVGAGPELVMLWTFGDQAPADGDPFDLGLQGIGFP